MLPFVKRYGMRKYGWKVNLLDLLLSDQRFADISLWFMSKHFFSIDQASFAAEPMPETWSLPPTATIYSQTVIFPHIHTKWHTNAGGIKPPNHSHNLFTNCHIPTHPYKMTYQCRRHHTSQPQPQFIHKLSYSHTSIQNDKPMPEASNLPTTATIYSQTVIFHHFTLPGIHTMPEAWQTKLPPTSIQNDISKASQPQPQFIHKLSYSTQNPYKNDIPMPSNLLQPQPQFIHETVIFQHIHTVWQNNAGGIKPPNHSHNLFTNSWIHKNNFYIPIFPQIYLLCFVRHSFLQKQNKQCF